MNLFKEIRSNLDVVNRFSKTGKSDVFAWWFGIV